MDPLNLPLLDPDPVKIGLNPQHCLMGIRKTALAGSWLRPSRSPGPRLWPPSRRWGMLCGPTPPGHDTGSTDLRYVGTHPRFSSCTIF